MNDIAKFLFLVFIIFIAMLLGCMIEYMIRNNPIQLLIVIILALVISYLLLRWLNEKKK
jgi:membrane protein implicated in regulation of membrane protease activity